MTNSIRLAAACALAGVSLTVGAQQAHAEQVCESTWTHSGNQTSKICGNWPSGPFFGDLEVTPYDENDWDGDQRILLQAKDDDQRCEDDLVCHFSWTDRSYDVSVAENVKFVNSSYIPTEIHMSCDCTLRE